MKINIISFLIFIAIIFVACENKQQNIEVQNTDSGVTTSTNEDVSTPSKIIEQEITYFPAIERYLTTEFGSKYLKGEYCVPFQTVIAVDERNDEDILVWGDFWVFNYNLVGDTLETVSGGSHPGLMHIKQTDTGFEVIGFDQIEDGSNYLPTAKRIFGDKYDAFSTINSNDQRREKHRAEILANYVKKHNIPATKYKDYGWPAKNLGD